MSGAVSVIEFGAEVDVLDVCWLSVLLAASSPALSSTLSLFWLSSCGAAEVIVLLFLGVVSVWRATISSGVPFSTH
ncbi:hypothetical protein [Psychrobacter sp. 16-MNA-CIBAN-0192]|uniref:hypothetical protein n=1 Tax=Psychrobacter sp. 16-MNA-CIBAN-0192 TaxID=3140448 RepID=UPI003329265F